MAKRTFQIEGTAFMTLTFDDSHPHFNDEDYLRHVALDAWRSVSVKAFPRPLLSVSCNGGWVDLEQKPHIAEVPNG